MLSATELVAYFEQHKIPAKGRALISHIRKSEPSRRAVSTPKSCAARYPSRKMGLSIQAESVRNELQAVYMWDHDDKTFEFYDQPPAIKVVRQDAAGRTRPRNVTPDFFLLQRGFAGWVECKTEQWLCDHVAEGGNVYRRDAEGHWRCDSGEEYAKEFGLGFKIRSSHETDPIVLANLKFLSDFLSDALAPVQPEERLNVLQIFSDRAFIPLHLLVDGKSADEAAIIYKMIAVGDLYVDLARQRISQPEFAKVYRDEATYQSHQILERSKPSPAIPQNPEVFLSLGERLSLEGTVFEVVNVRENVITLEGPNRQFKELTLVEAKAAIRQGLLTSVVDELHARSERQSQILAKASRSDLVDANRRYHWIAYSQGVPGYEEPPPGSSPSPKTISRWAFRYRRGQACHGNGFCELITKRSAKGNRSCKLQGDVKVMLLAHAEAWSKARDNTKIMNHWGNLLNACQEIGLVAPCLKTFRRACRQYSAHEVKSVHDGEKAAYSLEAAQDNDRYAARHGERPFEVGHIDHTQLDVQLRGAGPGELTRKPWLTVMMDPNARYVLARYLSFNAPSAVSCMMVIQECIRLHNRLPDALITDSGAEFDSIYYETLTSMLSVTKINRAKGKPRFGSPIERWFGISNQQFIHSLRGNNRALQNPRAMSASHDPRPRAIWNLSELEAQITKYIENLYHALEHPALGTTPQMAFTAGCERAGTRGLRYIPFDENVKMMCLPTTPRGKAKVVPGHGVKINYLYYSAPVLRTAEFEGELVDIRYDPMDISVAYAYLNGRWQKLRSEYATLFAHHSVQEIAILTKEIRARLGREYERSTINAGLIAKFLKEVGEHEASMLQRRKDEEWRKAHGDETEPLLPAHLREAGVETKGREPKPRGRPSRGRPPSNNDRWKNEPTQHYGEIQ